MLYTRTLSTLKMNVMRAYSHNISVYVNKDVLAPNKWAQLLKVTLQFSFTLVVSHLLRIFFFLSCVVLGVCVCVFLQVK